LASLVLDMVAAWLTAGAPWAPADQAGQYAAWRNRQITAVRALGTDLGRYRPRQTTALLRGAAGSDDAALRAAVAQTAVELFCEPVLRGKVLAELLRWTRLNRPHPRDTGFRAILWISGWLRVSAGRDGREWPALVWLAAREGVQRDRIVVLLARLMTAPGFVQPAHQEFAHWVRMAEADPSMRRPLAALLADLGRQSGDLSTICDELRTLAHERRGPAGAATDVLAIIEGMESTDGPAESEWSGAARTASG
jgi:hypothetical protein